MQLVKLIAAMLILGLFATPVRAVEYKWTGDRFVEVDPVPNRRAVTIPPGFPVIVDAVATNGAVLATDPCPNGMCPVNRRVGTFYSITDSTKTTHTESHNNGRGGLFSRIASNIRERREVRQSNRASRRSGGGCP